MATGSVDGGRPFEVGGPAIDDGYSIIMDHSDTTGEVARPLSDIAALSAPSDQFLSIIVAAGPEMAGKATEPF